MSVSRGASRFSQAVKSAIVWPIRMKIEPFSMMDMEQLPVFRETDHSTGKPPHFSIDHKDMELFSSRWRVRLRDSNTTHEDIARSHARKVEPCTDPPLNAEITTTVSWATYEKAMAEKDATYEQAMAEKDEVEAEIRREADPRGLYRRSTIDTAGLVKSIRKRHRNCLEDTERERNKMRIQSEDSQHKFDDEIDRLYCIMNGQNEAVQSRYAQDQQTRDNFEELQKICNDLLAENEAKDDRIAELEGQVETAREVCESVTTRSEEASRLADSRLQNRIARIEETHQEELGTLRQGNKTLQHRLNNAEREKAKKEELKEAKKEEIQELEATIDRNERETRDLKEISNTDREKLRETAEFLSDARSSLEKSETRNASYQDEVEKLNRQVTKGKDINKSRCHDINQLTWELYTVRAALRDNIIDLQADNSGLKATNDGLRTAIERRDKDLESWENGCVGSAKVYEGNSNRILPGTVAESLAKALKAANARADALQLRVNTLQAENRVFQEQPRCSSYNYDPQVQEQMERLQIENRDLREVAGEVETLKAQLVAHSANELEMLKSQYADRTRGLELGFNQGFESLRELRDQWFAQKRRLEEEHNRHVVAADLQYKHERQAREEQFMANCKEQEEKIRCKEDDLRSREDASAVQTSNAHSSGEDFTKMQSRAEEGEELVRQLLIAGTNDEVELSLTKQKLQDLENLGTSLRRDKKRQLDLFNEETNRMAQGCREFELHGELQDANHSLESFRDRVNSGETDSQALSRCLYGANFTEADVRFLGDQVRVVLLAQLQAAKRTLETLRGLLAEGPTIEMGMAVSILDAPRGDESAADPVDDIFGPSNELQQPAPPPQASTRKRTGAPLGDPTYGARDENVADDDWRDATLDTTAKTSSLDEILNRKIHQLKSRRN